MSSDIELKNACQIILDSGCLDAEETVFLEKCISEKDSQKFLEINQNDPSFESIFLKLDRVENKSSSEK